MCLYLEVIYWIHWSSGPFSDILSATEDIRDCFFFQQKPLKNVFVIQESNLNVFGSKGIPIAMQSKFGVFLNVSYLRVHFESRGTQL